VGDLGTDTAVEVVDGGFTATLSPDWEIWGPNGGYVAGVALRAAAAASRQPIPASITCHFQSVAAFGPVRLEVTPLRTARRAESLHVTMWQDGARVVDALVWMTASGDGLRHDAATAPDVEGPGGVPSVEDRLGPDADPPPFTFWTNLESRPLEWWDDPGQRPAGEPVVRNWYRYRPRATFDDPVVDATRSLILLDTMSWPSAVRAHPGGDVGFVAPTLSVSAQFHRAAPESDWLLVEGVSPLAEEGLIGFTSTTWSQDRRLLASASGQMMCRPTRG
jgi:acyl-CoA thioesterase